MNIATFDANHFEELGSEWALVSAGNAEKSNTMTIGWGGVGCMWGVKSVFIVIRKSRYTKEFIDAADKFTVAFMGEDYKKQMGFCGSKSGRDFDKWAETGITPVEADGTVYPKEAKLAFVCRKMAAIPMPEETFIDKEIYAKWYPDRDDHVMYIGEILEVIEKMDLSETAPRID